MLGNCIKVFLHNRLVAVFLTQDRADEYILRHALAEHAESDWSTTVAYLPDLYN